MKKKRVRPTLGVRLRRAGFDETRYDRATGHYRVRCSQCEALVINGIATHERGCPNNPRDPDFPWDWNDEQVQDRYDR
jgi:hypothetical protein